MKWVAFEIIFIIILLLLNGVFAMAEIAVVSARKARLQQRAEAGDQKARLALELANSPDSFLSTVQIGITLVGILAGAFGGATISEILTARLKQIPQLAPYSEAISLALVVLTITYLSLIIGELLPKRIGLNHPEKIAMVVAKPMRLLSRIASPAVYILSASTNALQKILGIKGSTEPPVTEEEIKLLITHGTEAGVFEPSEQNLVESIFTLDDLQVTQLMRPRLEIVGLNLRWTLEELQKQIINSPYSRLPVGDGSLDNLLGVVKAKDLLSRLLAGEPFDMRSSLRRPLFIPETTTALQLLELFKRSHTHLALVVDEHGGVEGLVTMYDVLEAMVGEMPMTSGQTGEYAVQREDSSWLLDGRLRIDEFKEIFSIKRMLGEESGVFYTLAGFILTHLRRLPSIAEHFEWNGLYFEIIDMDRKRIDKVLVKLIKEAITSEAH
jgi:putative hemolysin